MAMQGFWGRRQWMAMVLAVAASGCSLVNGPRQVVQVRSRPAGASVLLDGDAVGVTPAEVRVHRHNREPVLHIERDGFEPVERELERGFSSVFVGDLILAGFVGYANAFGAGTQGASGHGVIGRGALGVLWVLGPVLLMGSLFDFPEEVDVSLTWLGDGSEWAGADGRSEQLLVLERGDELADFGARFAFPRWGVDTIGLRERLRAVRRGEVEAVCAVEADRPPEGVR